MLQTHFWADEDHLVCVLHQFLSRFSDCIITCQILLTFFSFVFHVSAFTATADIPIFLKRRLCIKVLVAFPL